MNIRSIDIFCEIIDNFGDIGVVYRVAKELYVKYDKNVKIRVFLNRLDEFMEINKKCQNLDFQEIEGIEYITEDYLIKNIYTFETADVIIEAFGCNIYEGYLSKAKETSKLLLNLEYLSAENWVEDFHLQESPLGAKSLKKYFFVPGFTEKTGGIIGDSLYLTRKEQVNNNIKMYLDKYLKDFNLEYEKTMIGTIFSYEKNFLNLLQQLENINQDIFLIIMGEKSQNSFKEIFKEISIEKFGKIYKYGKIKMYFIDFLNQEEYEELINAVDFNFVRGEDSFIRALLSGKPFLWHAYLQDDLAHMDKVESFIDREVEYFKNKNFNLNILLEYNKLLKDYNFRKENSLEKSTEDYGVFFKNLKDIQEMFSDYSEFFIKKCNLINKLYNFIESY
ncbi:MAG: elongation factor P maturation arginine rhamnosyltransferase EarP [Cetobacterium sp.]